MSDVEMKSSEASQIHAAEEKVAPFSQAGHIADPTLNQLRDQIKKVMIPLLIKSFQLKLEHHQALGTPSPLQNNPSQKTREEVREQLTQLEQDVKMLQLWCQSCRSQIQKALTIQEEEQKNGILAKDSADANPAVSKSFSNALAGQPQLSPAQEEKRPSEPEVPSAEPKQRKKWWKSLLKKW